MCAVPNMAVFCSFLTSRFPGMLLTYFLNVFYYYYYYIHFTYIDEADYDISGVHFIQNNRAKSKIVNFCEFLQMTCEITLTNQGCVRRYKQWHLHVLYQQYWCTRTVRLEYLGQDVMSSSEQFQHFLSTGELQQDSSYSIYANISSWKPLHPHASRISAGTCVSF